MSIWTAFGFWIAGEGPVVGAVVPGDLSSITAVTVFDEYGDNLVPFAVSVLAQDAQDAKVIARENLLSD